jgi:hypothetical protein
MGIGRFASLTASEAAEGGFQPAPAVSNHDQMTLPVVRPSSRNACTPSENRNCRFDRSACPIRPWGGRIVPAQNRTRSQDPCRQVDADVLAACCRIHADHRLNVVKGGHRHIRTNQREHDEQEYQSAAGAEDHSKCGCSTIGTFAIYGHHCSPGSRASRETAIASITAQYCLGVDGVILSSGQNQAA